MSFIPKWQLDFHHKTLLVILSLLIFLFIKIFAKEIGAELRFKGS